MNTIRFYSALLVVGTLWACQSTPSGPESKVLFSKNGLRLWNDSAMAANGVEVGAPTEYTFGNGLHANGRVDIPPQSRASLTAPLGGFIRYLGPYEGSFVRKGEVLVRLDDPIYVEKQKELLSSAAAYELANESYRRAEKLNAASASSAREWQLALANQEEAHARWTAAREVVRQLGFNPEQIQQNGIQRSLSLVAPFAGYVRAVRGNLGQYVSAQQEIITLEDPQHMHLELAVFQNDIATLKRGQRFVYQVGSDPTPFSGIIQEIGQAQSSEGHFVVHGHPEQLPESGLRTGQFIRATVQTQQAVRWALPEDAVVYKDNQPFVLRKTKDGLEFQSVRISHQENGWVGFEDLASGTYVLKQAHLLLQPEETE